MFIQYGQTYNKCNQAFSETDHDITCHGNCERVRLSDLEVDLHNEVFRWQEAGMPIQGVPEIHPPLPQGGLGVNLLQLQLVLHALIEVLEIDKKVLDIAYKRLKLEKLTEMRKIREAELEARGLLIAKPTLITPDNGHFN